MMLIARRSPLVSLAEYLQQQLAVFMAAGHLKRAASGHLLRKATGHLVNDCQNPCSYCVPTPAPAIGTLPTALTIQNYHDPIFDFRPCGYDNPALPYWDGVFRNPFNDGGYVTYAGTSQRVKGIGGGWDSSDYPYSFLSFDPNCGIWNIFIGGAADAWIGVKPGLNPLGTYLYCDPVCAAGPNMVTLI
jgi:hypothetical protein